MDSYLRAARLLNDATGATLDKDYHKATALVGIALTHLMVAATPEVEEEEPSLPVRIHGRPVEDFLSACPRGWDTVLGYLARRFPERLDLIDLTPDATLRDGIWLSNRHRERYAGSPIKVASPAVLAEEGIERVNAYPTSLLAERFPE